jgi:hypothetical protein
MEALRIALHMNPIDSRYFAGAVSSVLVSTDAAWQTGTIAKDAMPEAS